MPLLWVYSGLRLVAPSTGLNLKPAQPLVWGRLLWLQCIHGRTPCNKGKPCLQQKQRITYINKWIGTCTYPLPLFHTLSFYQHLCFHLAAHKPDQSFKSQLISFNQTHTQASDATDFIQSACAQSSRSTLFISSTHAHTLRFLMQTASLLQCMFSNQHTSTFAFKQLHKYNACAHNSYQPLPYQPLTTDAAIQALFCSDPLPKSHNNLSNYPSRVLLHTNQPSNNHMAQYKLVRTKIGAFTQTGWHFFCMVPLTMNNWYLKGAP